MAAQTVRVWFDKEGDFIEVRFSDLPGYLRETDQDAVMERVDAEGNILGFTVMAVSRLDPAHPLVAHLTARSPAIYSAPTGFGTGHVLSAVREDPPKK